MIDWTRHTTDLNASSSELKEYENDIMKGLIGENLNSVGNLKGRDRFLGKGGG